MKKISRFELLWVFMLLKPKSYIFLKANHTEIAIDVLTEIVNHNFYCFNVTVLLITKHFIVLA